MITKTNLAESLAVTGVTKTVAAATVDLVLAAIADALAAGNQVKLAGIGTFTVKDTKARMARNPQSGEPVPVPAGKKVAFKIASDLKARL